MERLLQRFFSLFTKNQERYGPVYKRVGPILLVMYGGKIVLETEEQINEFSLILQQVGKLCRHVNDPDNKDHSFDNLGYAAIHASLVEERLDDCPF